MRYRKWVILIVCLLLFGVWAYFVYDVNERFSNPENRIVEQGQTASYKGLTIAPGEVEILSYQEMVERYPDFDSTYDEMGEEAEETIHEMAHYHYILVHLSIENPTDEKISFGKESITLWPIEVGVQGNGMDPFMLMYFNPGYDGSFTAHEKMDMILPYTIYTEYLTLEEIKKEDIRVVYSYYPTKNYIFYEGGERE